MTIDVVLRRHAPPALLAATVALLAVRWFGGYHPRHWTLAALALIAWACVELVRGTLPALRSAAGIALAAGVGLLAWTALSITWADYSKHLAWDETNRTAMYIAAFAVGAAVCGSGRALARMTAWLGCGIGIIGVIVLGKLVVSDAAVTLFTSARLDWPIGYSNGFAGLCLLGMWLLIGWSCAADSRAARIEAVASRVAVTEIAASALGLAGATMLAMLSILSQSRGGVLAAALSLPLAIIFFPNRTALLTRLGMIGVLVIAYRHSLTRPFETLTLLSLAKEDSPVDATFVLSSVRNAGSAICIAVVIAAIVGALLPIASRLLRRVGVPAWADVVPVALAVGAALAVVSSSSLTSWTTDQYHACVDPPEQAPASQPTSHFREVGSNRCDFWRVALLNAKAHPITGVGANNFQGHYVLERRSPEEPKQAHSLPLQMLGELGVVGAALFLTMWVVVLRGAWLYVRSGPGRDAGLAGAIAGIGFWMLQASEDWLWNIPAISLPPLILAGGFVACVSPAQRKLHPRAVLPIAIGIGVLAAGSLLPQGIADRAYRAARDPHAIRVDIGTAIDNAAVAAKFDPSWAAPVIHQGQLEYRRRNFDAAAALARDAAQREPANWSIRFQASALIKPTDKREAAKELAEAKHLNPRLTS